MIFYINQIMGFLICDLDLEFNFFVIWYNSAAQSQRIFPGKTIDMLGCQRTKELHRARVAAKL